MPNQTKTTFSDFARPEELAKENPHLFTASTVRYQLRYRKNNGLSECGAVVNIANRLYIHREKFIKWFASQTS